jgi:type IV secretory pathway TrbL component
MVYRAMAFDAQRAAQGDLTAQQSVETAARQAAAAQAAALVGAGAGVNGGASTPPGQPTGFKNYREAINAAYDEVERNQQGR